MQELENPFPSLVQMDREGTLKDQQISEENFGRIEATDRLCGKLLKYDEDICMLI